MKTSVAGEDLFHVVDTFSTHHGVSWDHCVAICTDGTSSMIGSLKGFVTRVKAKNPLIIPIHCFLYRWALVTKTMKEEFLLTSMMLCMW